jgi:pimeloyl-ACP methyl ester carboxylesterase
MIRKKFFCLAITILALLPKTLEAHAQNMNMPITYSTITVSGLDIFYRESGPKEAPAILLLHGYPSSSRMFEPLFPLLNKKYHLIAPDYVGFGLSAAPSPDQVAYTFDHLAKVVDAFAQAMGLTQYTLYMQDYGGPIGFRLALAHPERVKALIIQNAVIHEEGLSSIWSARRAFWVDRPGNEQKIRDGMYSVQAGIARHVGPGRNPQHFNPDLWMDEITFLKRPGEEAIQLNLVYDYQSNVTAYPKWQEYLRETRPPILVTWGQFDPIFTVAGAQLIGREAPKTEIHILDAGHFALDDHAQEIAQIIDKFLIRSNIGK